MQCRLTGRLFVSGDSKGAQEVPQIHLGRQNVSVHMPPLWPLQYTKSIYKTPSSGDGPFKETWPQVSDVSRQPASDGPREGIPDIQDNSGGGPTGEVRVHGEPGEISTGTNSRDILSGVCVVLQSHDNLSAASQGDLPKGVMQLYPETELSLSKGDSYRHWYFLINHSLNTFKPG